MHVYLLNTIKVTFKQSMLEQFAYINLYLYLNLKTINCTFCTSIYMTVMLKNIVQQYTIVDHKQKHWTKSKNKTSVKSNVPGTLAGENPAEWAVRKVGLSVTQCKVRLTHLLNQQCKVTYLPNHNTEYKSIKQGTNG